VLVVGCIALATADRLCRMALRREPRHEHDERYRRRLARSLLLGLEILVAADIVRTVALQATFAAFAELGLLVVVQTFLSGSIVIEIEGRSPWQPGRKSLLASRSEEGDPS
jgi:uncharacterized membrane protein